MKKKLFNFYQFGNLTRILLLLTILTAGNSVHAQAPGVCGEDFYVGCSTTLTACNAPNPPAMANFNYDYARYRWQKDGVFVSAFSASSDYTATTAGNYTCNITYYYSNEIIPNRTLTFSSSQNIATINASVSLSGAPASACYRDLLTITATITGLYTQIHWETWNGNSWIPMTGLTSTTFSIFATATNTNQQYRARVSYNGCYSAYSNVSSTYVNNPNDNPTTITYTAPATVCNGSLFTVTANINTPYDSIQWEVWNGTAFVPYSISTSNSIEVPATAINSQQRYRARLGLNGCYANYFGSTAGGSTTFVSRPFVPVLSNGTGIVCRFSPLTISSSNGGPFSFLEWERWNGSSWQYITGSPNLGLPAMATASNEIELWRARSNYLGCYSAYSSPIGISVTDLQKPILSGPTEVCDGSYYTITGVFVGDWTSIEYQKWDGTSWVANGGNFANILASITNGTQRFRARSVRTIGTNCISPWSDEIIITVKAKPAIPVLSAPNQSCYDNDFTVNASIAPPYDFIQWQKFNGDTWDNYTTSNAPSITVSADNIGLDNYRAYSSYNGCVSNYSNTTNTTVNPLPTEIPEISVSGSNIICVDGTKTLTATGASNYLWSTTETGSSIIVSSAGIYMVAALDVNGCSGTSSAPAIITNDTEPPVITCPENITENNDADECGAIVIFEATATDNCGTPTITYNPESGSLFAVGETTVTATAEDVSGNTSSCTFTVTVNDTQAPVINCNGDIIVDADAGMCGTNVTFGVTATDNCGIPFITYSRESGSLFAVGETTVTATAEDVSGNTSSCTFTVTVNDTQAPVINCNGDIIVDADAGMCSANVTFGVTATDNCGIPLITYSSESGSLFAVGETTVTATADDGNGNISQCTFIVQVNPIDVFYADTDTDGYGDPAISYVGCAESLLGVVTNNLDCDDTNPAINPDATEICWNNIDDNCDSVKSEGCAAIPVFVNNSGTITNFATSLSAVPYTYVGATTLDYRFEVTNISVTPNQTVTFTQTGVFARYFTIPVAIRGFDTDYTIRASAVIDGEEVPYAVPVINVRSTGIPTVKLSPTSCGVTLSRLNATLSANPAFNATSYEFRIRLTSDTAPLPTYYYAQSLTRFIGANSFNGLSLQYGTSYSVAVRYTTASVGATVAAITSDFGDECIITTPSIPLISLSSPTCGSTLDRFGATISANPATYAQQYQFRVRLTSDNGPTPTYFTTIPNASRYSSLMAAQGLVLANGTQYSVSVRYSIPVTGEGTEFSGYGSECIVITPGTSTARAQIAPFSVVAYPNPFSEGFQLDVKTPNAGIVSIKTYDMLGRLIEERSSKANVTADLSIGANYPSGVYNVIVSQDEEIRTVRVVKR